ncbi:FAR1 DNA-binding domain-containing protein [Hirsutella rhossiliensis]|uniref:FAR1 DNA-binding domain-containing protein n=1 Tax=Hirsutella rhossiliensis TaxID=111463 RepID=A0A9P8SJ57_9HYPO|nr:FAR1 DNA-binding domain-containing protein [Hirsutella rhossiliensis]KAH0962721.1 FAR1 DNA-binding domain-containing protein [Hirsutella rhossiliensis]
MFGILEAVAVPHSGIYASCEELMRDLNARAEKEGYKIVKARSHRSRPGAPIVRADLVCERGGRPYRCQATKHKTSTKKTNCPWKAKAVDRKLVGGWVLTVICDHHNHEPGTPEPPTPTEGSEASDDEELVEEAEGPRPDTETAAALQVAGVSDAVLRLSGDTFHRFKNEYRKMSQPERLGILAQMQLRIAAIYAVQNEDMLRQKRQDAQNKRHQEIEDGRKRLEADGLQSVRRQRAPRLTQQDALSQATPEAAPDAAVAIPEAPLATLDKPQATPDALQQNSTHSFARLAPALAMQSSQPAMQQPRFQRTGPTPIAPRPPQNTATFHAYPGPSKRPRAVKKPQKMTRQTAQQQALPSSQEPAQRSAESTSS